MDRSDCRAGGRIDRDAPLGFSLDGKRLTGYRGDTLASALLATGVRVVGRSFKYHRPRGFLSAGTDEPNGLFTLGKGNRTEPNAQGTVIELAEGLSARSQNARPSVHFDFGAINSWIAPVLQAGFYYKTFMGPTRRSWMVYERFIRRAAGLGTARHEPDPDRYETCYAFTDVLVIGAGPAGLSAALAAGRAGARVILAEQDGSLGGTLLSDPATGDTESWHTRMEAELQSLPRVKILPHTTAVGIYSGNTVALVTRRDHCRPDPTAGEALQIVTTVRAKAVVHATGAIERPLIFGNNDRPGIMLASAVRTYLNRYAVACGRRAVVLTNNDSAYAAAFDLAPQIESVVVADRRRAIDPSLAAKAASLGIEVHTASAVADVRGQTAVRGVILGPVDGGPRIRSITCDLLCMSGGWSPLVHLSSHGGIKPRYHRDSAAFVPGGYAPGHFGAGRAERLLLAGDGDRGRPGCGNPGGQPQWVQRSYGEYAAAVAGCGCVGYAQLSYRACLATAWRTGRQGFRGLPERCDRAGSRDCAPGRIWLGRAPEALHHSRHGHRPGQDQQHQCARDHGAPAGRRHRGRRHHDLPAALHSCAHRCVGRQKCRTGASGRCGARHCTTGTWRMARK